MTPERKAQLEARMELLITSETKRLACDRNVSNQEAHVVLEELAEIAACIGTAWLALNMGRPR